MEFIAMMLDPDLSVRAHFWDLWGILTVAEREQYDRIAIRRAAGSDTDTDRKRAEELWHLAEERFNGVG